jgi:hypothetical protein
MLSRDGKIGNSAVVRPGHSFVLISDNPNFQTDEDLYEQFEK